MRLWLGSLLLLDHSVWIAMLCGRKSLVLGGTTICIIVILTKWFLFTRLETRTKESNIYASIWVVNPRA
jgi:hypothetical protein